MTDDDQSTGHDDVMSDLLDLQRRLRGDRAGIGEVSRDDAAFDRARATTIADGSPPSPPDVAEITEVSEVEVSEHDLSVLMTPSLPRESGSGSEGGFAPVTQLPTAGSGDDRIALLAERLSRLETDLSGVLGSIDAVRDEVQRNVAAAVTADVDAKVEAMQADTEARVERSIAVRLDTVEFRLVAELRGQRDELTGLVEDRFHGMNASLRDAIREAAEADRGTPETGAGTDPSG